MSIIYDALKKAEKTAVNSGQNTKPSPNNFRLKPYLLYGFVAAVGFFLTGLVFSLIGPKLKNMQFAKLSEKNVALYHALPKDTSMFKTKPGLKPAFVLNGVFFSDNEAYALVNNQIVKEADVVAGALVKKIDMSKVELAYQGSSISLSNE